MDLLLDTHTLLWFSENNTKLSKNAKALIENISNCCFVSIASIWEISIKISIGKLSLAINIDELINEIKKQQFIFLPISYEHAAQVSKLKFHHRDPFDRLLISQSLIDNIPLLSADEMFDKYAIQRVW